MLRIRKYRAVARAVAGHLRRQGIACQVSLGGRRIHVPFSDANVRALNPGGMIHQLQVPGHTQVAVHHPLRDLQKLARIIEENHGGLVPGCSAKPFAA